jgi:hypothetical protein
MWGLIGTMQQQLWGSAVAAVIVAVLSGLGERRRHQRRRFDRVGFMPWPLIQLLAMLAAVICTSVALNLR